MSTPTQSPDARMDTLSKQIATIIGKIDASLTQWAGGNTQFEATRFVLHGKRAALVAVQDAIAGDTSGLKDL